MLITDTSISIFKKNLLVAPRFEPTTFNLQNNILYLSVAIWKEHLRRHRDSKLQSSKNILYLTVAFWDEALFFM